METIDRRTLLLLAATSMLLAVPTVSAAKDGDSGGGGGDSDSGSDTSSNSGSGSDGDSDSGGDDTDDDKDDDNDENSGHGRSGNRRDQDRARDAVKRGQAVSLKVLMAHVRRNYSGKIIDVDLKRRSLRYVYQVKILGSNQKLQTVRLDALTLGRL